LPLMLTAVADGRLTQERLVHLMSDNPRRIFHLPEQPDTWIEVDTDSRYDISNDALLTRCGWSPFAGMSVRGRLMRVVLRGRARFDDGRVIT